MTNKTSDNWGQWDYLSQKINDAQASAVKVGSGSGVTIDGRYILTAAHVPLHHDDVDWNTQVTNIWGESSGIADIWYDTDNGNDIAIIELSDPFTNFNGIKLAETDNGSGDLAFQVGHPSNVAMAGKGWAVTFGESYGFVEDQFYTAHDINSYGGYSGSGMFNENGELIGIVSATGSYDTETPYYTPNKEVINEIMDHNNEMTSYAVSLDVVKDFMADNEITQSPGGNTVLPPNEIDTYKSYVDEHDLLVIESVSDILLPSAVAIFNDGVTQDNLSFMLRGSGTIIGDDLILTNAHVADGLDNITVGLIDGLLMEGRVLAVHENADLAIIKMNQTLPENFARIKVADSAIASGESGFAIGNPGDLWWSEGGWHVSALSHDNDFHGENVFHGSSMPGNSGSGIYNMDGDLSSVLWASGTGGMWAQHGDLIDRQDPHTTAHNPSSDPESSQVIGVDFKMVEDFVTKYGGTSKGDTTFIYDTSIGDSDKTLVIGREYIDGESKAFIGRLNDDGSMDNSFGGDGKMVLSSSLGDVYGETITQVGNEMLITANHLVDGGSESVIFKITEDDAIDPYFGVGGFVRDSYNSEYTVLKDSAVYDGYIYTTGTVLGNSDNDFFVNRYDMNGQLDTSFGTSGWMTVDASGKNDYAEQILVSDDGIFVGGYGHSDSTLNDFIITKFNTNGSLDTTFGSNGISIIDLGGNDKLLDMEFTSDGSIVATGNVDLDSNGVVHNAVKVDSDGDLVTSFGNNGIFIDPSIGFSYLSGELVVHDNDEITLMASHYINQNSMTYTSIDLTANGSKINGADNAQLMESTYASMTYQSDGNIMLVGVSMDNMIDTMIV